MTTQKHIIGIIAFCFAAITFTYGQNAGQSDRFERIENEKKAYITKSLNLTSAEAKKFFPIYEQYHDEMGALQKAKRKERTQQTQRQQPPPRTTLQSQRNSGLRNDLNSSSDIADRDMIAFDSKKVELKKNYRKRFAEVIGQARASQFFQVEEEFHDYLMQKLQNRGRSQRNP